MCFGRSRTDSDPVKRSQGKPSKRQNRVKLLLLGFRLMFNSLKGAGESGKSTIAKQIKIIHLDGFTEAERNAYKSIIFSNLVASIRALVQNARKKNEEITAEESAEYVMKEENFDSNLPSLSPDLVEHIKTLWKDPGIQKTFARSGEFQLLDSAEYYFTEIDRLAEPQYVPSVQDILRCRAKTTGITEIEFTVQKTRFVLVDVGGQRSERRKWMHCFQEVTAVIFCTALSEYDLQLHEDETTNRMHESLKLFKDICNSRWFAETSIILFLNKKDLFANKITKIPLTVCFPDYDMEHAGKYIEDQFVAHKGSDRKLIYTHHTCATDTSNITVVFNAVQDIFLNDILNRLGM